jgi:tetratricopeptide (TPR) repeat protein
MQHPAPRTVIILALLAGLCLLVFGQTVGFEFTNLDDDHYVTDNPDLARGLTPGGVHWAFTTRHGDLWMPATWLSYLADEQLFGLQPAAFHRTNLVLHLLGTLMLFWFLRSWTGACWRPSLVAALFAVHPLHVESVAWVAERKDVLSGVFFLLALHGYLRYARRSQAGWYAASVLLFLVALLAKPMVVTLPVILLLVDLGLANRTRSWRRLAGQKLPFLLLAGGVAAATYVLARSGENGVPDAIPLLTRLGHAAVYLVLYLGRLIWPRGLSVFYPPESFAFSILAVASAVALVAALTWAAWRLRRREPLVLAGWLWYLVMMLPILNLVQGGMQLMSDRYFYLPSIGLLVAVVWGARTALAGRQALRFGAALAIVAVLLAAAGGYRQTRVWRCSETLFRHALQHNEGNYLALMNLGVTLDDAGRSEEALPYLQRAVALRRDALHHFNLANNLAHLDRQVEAIDQYEQAVSRQPDFPTAHNNLAIALAGRGDWQKAGEHLVLAVQQDPDYAGAWYNLGLVQLQQGQAAAAKASFLRTLALDPGHTGALGQVRQLATAGQ